MEKGAHNLPCPTHPPLYISCSFTFQTQTDTPFLLPSGTHYWSPPPAVSLGPSYGVPAASCACTGGIAAQSTAADAAKGWPLPRPDNVACSLFVSATIPAFPAWVCSGSPAAPAKGITRKNEHSFVDT